MGGSLRLVLLLLIGALTACAGGGSEGGGPAEGGSTGGGGAEGSGASGAPHSRQKRLLWVTNDGRLALPPGTALTITPTISMPFVRYPPDGFLSNMSISLPFTSEYTHASTCVEYRQVKIVIVLSFGARL